MLLHQFADIQHRGVSGRFNQRIGGLRNTQQAFSFVQSVAKIRLLLIGHAIKYKTLNDAVFAAALFPYNRNPVLTVNHVKLSIAEADDGGSEETFIPFHEQFSEPFGSDGTLIRQAGIQHRERQGTKNPGILKLQPRVNLLCGFLRLRRTMFLAITHLFDLL